jgi:RNA polymerase sigma factor (sigma-70 family)
MSTLKAAPGDSVCGAEFPSTHWSVVLAAGQRNAAEAEQALAKLCEAYWYPLYAFLRQHGHAPAQAEDLTQEFLARLIQKESFNGLTQEGGRFRSFLLTALKRFLANEWRREHALKGGGGSLVAPIDATAERRYQGELADTAAPDILFERRWAFVVLDRVLARLRAEYEGVGKAELFAALQGCLPGADAGLSYAEAAAALHLGEGAVRMAAHRLRRRYGELLRQEVVATVATPAQIDDEIRYLIKVIGG